ncbi:MAG: TolC family protein, partial [Bacteroidota bacterium]
MKRIIFGILAVFAMSVTGQEVMTLERAISLALEHNLLLKINETDIQIAENNNTWGRAGKYPTIDLNSTFQSTLINDNNPASFLNGTFFTGGLGIALDVNWQVYNGGRVKISKDQLEVAITQNRQQRDLTIQNLIRDVTLAYQNVLFQQERYDLLAETLKLSLARLDYEETKRDFGGSNAFN